MRKGALLPPGNLGGNFVWGKKMDQVLISVLPSARHMSRGRFPYAYLSNLVSSSVNWRS